MVNAHAPQNQPADAFGPTPGGIADGQNPAYYRALFNAIDEGFAIHEVLTDEKGRVVDMIYREANAAFERHSGIRDVIGRTAIELFTHTEQAWLDALTRVYQTGIGERVEGSTPTRAAGLPYAIRPWVGRAIR